MMFGHINLAEMLNNIIKYTHVGTRWSLLILQVVENKYTMYKKGIKSHKNTYITNTKKFANVRSMKSWFFS